MLAPVTTVVLCLALGAAPVPVLKIRPGEPHGAPSAETRSPSPPIAETPSPPPSTPEAPSVEAPSLEVPSPEVPSPEPPDTPSTDEPSNEGEPIDTPTTDAPSSDVEPTDTPLPDEPPSDVEPTDEPSPEDDDPFGEHADEEPFPEEDGDQADAEPLPDYDPLRDSPQAQRARHWVHTGIGTMAAGGALLIGAIIMGATDPCARRAGNSCQVDARNRAALVMGIPAALLIGGGAAMLGVGMSRQRRLALDLQAGRTSFGVVVRGRF